MPLTSYHALSWEEKEGKKKGKKYLFDGMRVAIFISIPPTSPALPVKVEDKKERGGETLRRIERVRSRSTTCNDPLMRLAGYQTFREGGREKGKRGGGREEWLTVERYRLFFCTSLVHLLEEATTRWDGGGALSCHVDDHRSGDLSQRGERKGTLRERMFSLCSPPIIPIIIEERREEKRKREGEKRSCCMGRCRVSYPSSP